MFSGSAILGLIEKKKVPKYNCFGDILPTLNDSEGMFQKESVRNVRPRGLLMILLDIGRAQRDIP